MVSAFTLPEVTHSRLGDEVYDILRDAIIEDHYVPGQRLDLEAVARELGVSRTPLKEALLRLARDGLVRVVPRLGTYVAELSADELRQSIDLRRILEVYAVGLVVDRVRKGELEERLQEISDMTHLIADNGRPRSRFIVLDHQFHESLVACSGNSRLIEAHARENTHWQVARVRFSVHKYETYDRNLAQQEHEEIISRIIKCDTEGAKAAADHHLTRGVASLLDEYAHSRKEGIAAT